MTRSDASYEPKRVLPVQNEYYPLNQPYIDALRGQSTGDDIEDDRRDRSLERWVGVFIVCFIAVCVLILTLHA